MEGECWFLLSVKRCVSVKPGEEISFELTLEAKWFLPSYVFGGLTWLNGRHQVKTPIVVGGATV